MTLWLLLTALFTTIACAIPGSFLVLKRMSLTGDAISHSVLPGIVLGFLVSGSLDSPWLIAGAAACGWLTVFLIQMIHRRFHIREDAATGIVFTSMFAIGMLLLRGFVSKIDLDPDCVLFGNLETAIHGHRIPVFGQEIPAITVHAFGAAMLAIIATALFFHRFVASSFDPKLSLILGLSPERTSTILLGLTSVVVVIAFQAVGALMTVALLVLPASTALLMKTNVRHMPFVVCLLAALSSVGGLRFAILLNLNLGAAIVLTGAAIFVIALVAGNFRRDQRPAPAIFR